MNGDPFVLFDLPARWRLDESLLASRWQALQRAVHPDRHAHADSRQQQEALWRATALNDAYRTLKDPIARAEALIARATPAAASGQGVALSPAFLETQMELREALHEAIAHRDEPQLARLAEKAQTGWRETLDALGRAIDDEQDWQSARRLVQEAQFWRKLKNEIDAALTAIDDINLT